MPISIRVRQTPPNLAKTIGEAPRMARGRMSKAAAVYLIGNGRHGLTHYPSYKYIKRAKAYGKTFASDAQRRFVMAGIRSGKIDPGYPHRTGRLQRGWYISGSGAKVSVRNNKKHADVVMGLGQARLNSLVGWRIFTKVVSDNLDGMIMSANNELRSYFKEKGVTIK